MTCRRSFTESYGPSLVYPRRLRRLFGHLQHSDMDRHAIDRNQSIISNEQQSAMRPQAIIQDSRLLALPTETLDQILSYISSEKGSTAAVPRSIATARRVCKKLAVVGAPHLQGSSSRAGLSASVGLEQTRVSTLEWVSQSILAPHIGSLTIVLYSQCLQHNTTATTAIDKYLPVFCDTQLWAQMVETFGEAVSRLTSLRSVELKHSTGWGTNASGRWQRYSFTPTEWTSLHPILAPLIMKVETLRICSPNIQRASSDHYLQREILLVPWVHLGG